MGFWSALGKIGKAAAGFIPGVGPIIQGGMDATGIGGGGGWRDLVGAGLDAAGAIGAGREAGRNQENLEAIKQDEQRLLAQRNFENALMDRGQLDLKQREFAQKSRGTNYQDALRSALAMNMKDAAFNRPSGVPMISLGGGMRPSALGAEGRAAAEEMNRQAMASLLAGEKFDALPELKEFEPTKMKRGGIFDTILGVAGSIGKAGRNLEAQTAQNEQTSMIKKMLAEAQARAQAGLNAPPPAIGDFRDPRKLF